MEDELTVWADVTSRHTMITSSGLREITCHYKAVIVMPVGARVENLGIQSWKGDRYQCPSGVQTITLDLSQNKASKQSRYNKCWFRIRTTEF